MNFNDNILSLLTNKIVRAALPEAFKLYQHPQTYWNTEINFSVSQDLTMPIVCDFTQCRFESDIDSVGEEVEKCI